MKPPAASGSAHDVLDRPPPAPGPPPGGRSAILALARAESARLLRHPALWAATALYAAFWLHDLAKGDRAHRFPVLQDESWFIHLPLLLVAAGVLLAANQGALRSHRDSTEPAYEVLAVGRARRIQAHLLSLLPAAGLSLLLTVARIGYLASRSGAVGEVRPWELLAGPLCVLLAGVVGVLLSTFATSGAIAPVATVGLGVLTLAGAVTTGSRLRWLGPLAFENENAAALPTALTDRPAAAHLLWLAALAVLFSAVAVVCAGGRRSAVWRTTTAAALAGALAAGILQTGGIPSSVADRRAAFTEHPAAHQGCVKRSGISYCAFPGFEKWTAQWAAVGQGVLRYAPPDVPRSGYAVRQRVFPSGGVTSEGAAAPLRSWARDDIAAGTPRAVTVGTDWSDGAAGGDRRSDEVAGFAAEFAYRVVTGKVPEQPRLSMVCGSRAVLVLWLAAEATPGTREAMRSTYDRTFGGGITLPLLGSSAGLSFEPRAASFAAGLIDRPNRRSEAAVTENWAELAAPGTSVNRAAELLGVRAPAAVPASEQVAGC